ncbi:hypothetical protein [Streptomyces telluris]|uniref:Uncharacterized protein n=1 Tax=Streptomyces telluris TaxID=2720021 RepID=A0A9X2LDB4_9ACTN|nr:hypothetical protein [Streptomyces telluris]MCQ8769202.1 hypothetical protein [Streptomyces telluris]NJP81304.1 hypothetical protein [Streptomyces telluris]
MAFGRSRNSEPPVEVVDWRAVERFKISTVERDIGPGRKRPVVGQNAVRVPRIEGQERINAPCAFFGSRTARVGTADHVVYEDEGTQRVLCSIGEPTSVGDERRYRVYDGQGQDIGGIRRLPPSHQLHRHTWRIEQPGHPEITGLNKWSTLNPLGVAAHAAGKVLGGLAMAVFMSEPDGGDQRDRTLLWSAGREKVMESDDYTFTVMASWLDRRLAFAVAMLGDR